MVLTEYLRAALESAHYEFINDPEPFYGHIPALKGVWATGKTLEECRRNLSAALEDWLLFSFARGLDILRSMASSSLCRKDWLSDALASDTDLAS